MQVDWRVLAARAKEKLSLARESLPAMPPAPEGEWRNETKGVAAGVFIFAVETVISSLLTPLWNAVVTAVCFFGVVWWVWRPSKRGLAIATVGTLAIAVLTFLANDKGQKEQDERKERVARLLALSESQQETMAGLQAEISRQLDAIEVLQVSESELQARRTAKYQVKTGPCGLCSGVLYGKKIEYLGMKVGNSSKHPFLLTYQNNYTISPPSLLVQSGGDICIPVVPQYTTTLEMQRESRKNKPSILLWTNLKWSNPENLTKFHSLSLPVKIHAGKLTCELEESFLKAIQSRSSELPKPGGSPTETQR